MNVYYNDIDAFCCKVLRKNIALGNLPEGKVDERDIRDVHAGDFVGYQHVHLFAGIGAFPLGLVRAEYPSSIRTLSAGFPCQPFSLAGERKGEQDERYLWPEVVRVIREFRPECVFLENVPGLLSMERGQTLGTILADLAAWLSDNGGGRTESICLRAADFGAPHIRERVFLVAYPDKLREPWKKGTITRGECGTVEPASIRGWKDRAQVAHTSSSRRQECISPTITREQRHATWRRTSPGMEDTTGRREWEYSGTGTQERTQPLNIQSGTRQIESGVCGSADGFSNRVDRSHRWPAGPGERQHDWEPSRTVTERQPDRAKRLKALGNAIVPQCVEYVARCVLAALESEEKA